MAVGKNKERVMISLEKELIKYIKERAKKNGRTISNEISRVFEDLKISDEAIK
ncbi:hypothetical protein [Clostridium diolis]|uniref:hypothetical protein n=1 Tax=Clostridium diolis TaxID=223919 RepID=UPI0015C5CB1E|nr:hypothetical protein [Clostridium diolis]